MKTQSYPNTKHSQFNYETVVKSSVKHKPSVSKESIEVTVLFSGIYKSENFTIDAAHHAFSGIARKK